MGTWREYQDNFGNTIELKDKNIELLKRMRKIRNLLVKNDYGEINDQELDNELTLIRIEISKL